VGDPLRALIVEDVEADALLLVRELKRGGFDVTFERVDTPETMSAALDEQSWDVVLSDYSMPRFSALAALALVKERKINLPFIIVSGTVGEETAVEAIRAGAHDFMVKGKFARLIPAIERELRDAELRASKASMQEQLIISDRMATMGTLAAGVAHEINNPLAALMANLDFTAQDVARLAEDVKAGGQDRSHVSSGPLRWGARLGEIEDSLRDACEAADRVRLIVRDLKVFSRSDGEKTGAVDVRHVLESSLRMAWNEIRHRAVLVKDYGEVPPVHGNEGRLGQVFLNVLINSAQAITAGRAEHNEIRVVTRVDERGHVLVEVRDTGSGIPEGLRSEIFDPFFTTKPIGTGTGLGLAICRQIVTGFGGRIEVESEVDEGTTMRIVLPPSTGDPPAAASEPEIVSSSRKGRILVVDDEPFLGRAIKRMLSGEHDVTALTSARAASAHIAGGHRFDVILCDLMMPDMTGMELYAQLSGSAPGQAEKMVFMTGGAFTPQAREFLDRVTNQRIDKPFEAATIRALVHRILR
jgi:signal transduction histidine kinase